VINFFSGNVEFVLKSNDKGNVSSKGFLVVEEKCSTGVDSQNTNSFAP